MTALITHNHVHSGTLRIINLRLYYFIIAPQIFITMQKADASGDNPKASADFVIAGYIIARSTKLRIKRIVLTQRIG